MDPSEIVTSVMLAVFGAAFALWARRLDKALDLLERIQQEMHQRAITTERRLSRLEAQYGDEYNNGDSK